MNDFWPLRNEHRPVRGGGSEPFLQYTYLRGLEQWFIDMATQPAFCEALLDRTLPSIQRLLADDDWDTVLVVLHGGVNRAILSWFLTGQPVFLGGLAQDPACLNVIDVGPSVATSIVRVVNFCALDTLQTASRLSTMEHLLGQYMKLRSARGAGDPA